MPPKVLILLAAFRGERWIVEQVDSILHQLDVHVTLLIRDDRSPDSTLRLLQAQYHSQPNVILYSARSGSGSAGLNFLNLIVDCDTRGFDYVAFADQDDLWVADKLKRAIEKLRAAAGQGYSSAVEARWASGRAVVLSQNPVTRSADFLFEGGGQGCTFVLTRDNFDKASQFCRLNWQLVSQFHYHDWLLYLVTRAWEGTWVFDDMPSVHYRQHENNEIGARGGWVSWTRRIRLLNNGWYAKQVQLASRIFLAAGGRSAVVDRFVKSCQSGSTLTQMAVLLKHGRRRLTDRIAQSIFLVIGVFSFRRD